MSYDPWKPDLLHLYTCHVMVAYVKFLNKIFVETIIFTGCVQEIVEMPQISLKTSVYQFDFKR